MTEAPPRPLYVTAEELAAEEAYLYELDNKIASLERQWEEYVAAYPDLLVVTQEEYNKEVAEIRRLETRLKQDWTRWGHYMSTRRRSLGVAEQQETRSLDLTRSIMERYYFGRVAAFYRRSAATYLGLIRRTRRTITTTQEAIERERDRLPTKFIMPPGMELVLADLRRLTREREKERERFQRKTLRKPIAGVIDSITGFQIMLYETAFTLRGETGRAWLYDEEKRGDAAFIHIVKAVRTEKTFSVDTKGHESLVAEVTCYSIIDSEDLTEVKRITGSLEKKAIDWFIEQFTNYTKDGVPVVPNFTIEQDFTIQERNEAAKFEGAIKQWMQTLEGWTEMPRILKVGIGYYQTEDKPIWNRARIYIEYAHEQRKKRRLPSEGWTEIDP